MTITVGVIGCGNISRFHFQGLAQSQTQGQVRIARVCDLNPAASAPYAAKFGAQATTDWREVIADPAVDAVVITTISRVHKPICLAAIAAGKAVICEKTLAENPDDALAIVQAAERAGTLFWTSYMKRFSPAFAKAKELLPQLGRIQSTHIRAYQDWGDLWDAMPAEGFFHTPAGGASPIVRNYGGGILVCGGSHILDLVNFFHGRPTKLYASIHEPAGRDYDLQAAALLETAHGPVHYEALAHSLRHTGFLGDGWDEQVEIIGSKGKLQVLSAKWDEPELKSSLLIHEDAASGTRTQHHFPCVSPFTLALQHFCTCIAKREQGAQPRTTGYDVDELIAHIQRSGREGRALTVAYRC